MTIESHVKRLHTDSYDHVRRITAPSRQAVPPGPYRAVHLRMRGSCEQAPKVVPIGKRPNKVLALEYPQLLGTSRNPC
jgi:hypothetical protein